MAILALSGLLLAIVGVVAGLPVAVSPPLIGEAAAEAPPTSAGVVSPRRAPDVLLDAQAQRRLDFRMLPLLERLPERSCLVAEDGPVSLMSKDSELPISAASNQKLLTAAAVLSEFGPGNRFATRIASTDPDLGDGVVNGDLYVIGAGDPIIETPAYQAAHRHGPSRFTPLSELVSAVREAGVRAVTGSIVGDESRYDTLRDLPEWPDRFLRQNQLGPLSAMSVNDSFTYPAVGEAGAIGQAPDPAQYAAAVFGDQLRASGGEVSGPPRSGIAPEGLTDVVSVPSLSTSELAAQLLTQSDNNTAELLVKELGVATGAAGTTADGVAALDVILTGEGYPMDGVEIVDGSGLAIENRVTCQLLIEILRRDGVDGPLSSGLAVAGETGTLEPRYGDSPARGRVKAKTGSLNTISALSGWATTHDDSHVRFAMVFDTGDVGVGNAELELQEQFTEAFLTYPESVDRSDVVPQ